WDRAASGDDERWFSSCQGPPPVDYIRSSSAKAARRRLSLHSSQSIRLRSINDSECPCGESHHGLLRAGLESHRRLQNAGTDPSDDAATQAVRRCLLSPPLPET